MDYHSHIVPGISNFVGKKIELLSKYNIRLSLEESGKEKEDNELRWIIDDVQVNYFPIYE